MGPLHEYAVASVAEPVSVNVLPEHNVVADAEAETEIGVLLTVTLAVVAVVLPQLLLAVSVYTPAEAGVTTKPAGLRSVEA